MPNFTTKIFATIFTIVLGMATLTACTESQKELEPNPTPVKTVTPIEKKVEVKTSTTPSPVPDINASDILIRFNGDLEDNDWLDISETQKIIEDYAAAQLDPYFMSGEWLRDADGEKFVEPFKGLFSNELIEELSDLTIAGANNSHLINSLAAVLNPHGSYSAPEKCVSNGDFRECLADDVIITDVDVTESNVNEGIVKMTFTMSTSRLLYDEELVSFSDVTYTNTLWYDLDERHIVSVQNSFIFDEVLSV